MNQESWASLEQKIYAQDAFNAWRCWDVDVDVYTAVSVGLASLTTLVDHNQYPP